MKQSYYLIKQVLPHIPINIIKIHEPCNVTHLKQLISTLIGEIYVYHYDKEDNSRKDLTETLGNSEFNIYEHRFENIGIRKHMYINNSLGMIPKYITTYGIYKKLKETSLDKIFYMGGHIYFHNGTEMNASISAYNGTDRIEPCWTSSLFISNIEEHKRKNTYGDEYEKYIANKYEENGYRITLNGINKSYNDGGIDVIAENEDTVILVQCKNWSLSNDYKINQKDLRAFIGDCYLYVLENSGLNKSIGFHFIVSHDNILSKSAEIFLNKNTLIKFKCIPFEVEK